MFSAGESIALLPEPEKPSLAFPQLRGTTSSNQLLQKELPGEEQFAAQVLLPGAVVKETRSTFLAQRGEGGEKNHELSHEQSKAAPA
jgi:hypothetical protein